MNRKQPSCFISYSHDSDTHRDWVRTLAEHLQSSGIETRLDQWDLRFGMNITKYMEESVASSDYVLMVCTPSYAERANNATGGVGWEKQIISGEMYYQISSESKFVPLLRHNDQNAAIPRFLRGKYYVDFSNGNLTQNLEGLLRHLYDSPRYVRPLLGSAPSFASNIHSASVSPILPEIFELSEIADRWHEAKRPYHHVEKLSDGLIGLIRHPPAEVAKADEPLCSFLLLAGLHHGGNWFYWLKKSLDAPNSVSTILAALSVSYERVRFRAHYALQYFDFQKVQQLLENPIVRVGPLDKNIIEQHMQNKSVKAYLLEKGLSSGGGLAEKIRSVISEIDQYES